jgi:hypothetical protein
MPEFSRAYDDQLHLFEVRVAARAELVKRGRTEASTKCNNNQGIVDWIEHNRDIGNQGTVDRIEHNRDTGKA